MDYCFHCMAKLEKSGGICSECGYDNRMNTNGIGFLPGCVLNDQYVIGEALGRGGFGITYMGLDLRLNRKVAVKEYFPVSLAVRDPSSTTLHPLDMSVKEDFDHGIERVMREAGLAASLDDIPNIVRIYNVIPANGTVYIIMEYIRGMTLSKYVQKEGGKLSWLKAWTLLQPIMAALGKIHSHGVVHRDVSPDNIMIREDGSPVLLDFGAAQNITSGNTSHSVSLRMGYAPLEQFSTTGPRDGRSDQYSMMATLYYALTGKEPESFASIEEMKGPRAMGADIPEGAEKVLIKGMSRKMEDRYPSMEALIEAFERASSSEYTRIVSDTMENHPTEIGRSAGKNQLGTEKGSSTERYTETAKQGIQSSVPDEDTGKKKKSNKVVLGIAAAAAVVVLLGAVIWPWYQKKTTTARNYELYSSALEHISAGRYEEAIEILNGLGDFEGAGHQREIAEQGIEARNNAAAYAEAQTLAENGQYAEAGTILENLGGYSDSAQQAALMHKHVDLEKANALLEQGEYEQALEIYRSLESFENAEEKKKVAEAAIEEKNNAAAYAAAQKLELEGRYEEARDAYAALAAYRDSSEQAEKMQKYVNLQKANALMEQGEYDLALELYTDLGSFMNAPEQKKLAEAAIEQRKLASAYEAAQQLEQAGKYKEARDAYAKLGTYLDSSDKATKMQAHVDLQNADIYMSRGQYDKALEIYTALGNFETAAEKKKQAEKAIEDRRLETAYTKANTLAENGQYTEALEIYRSLGSYRDSVQLAAKMSKHINLQKADALMEQGEYEQALEIYQSLGDFDSAGEKRIAAEEALERRRNAAAYEEAQALEQAGRYDEAQKAYAALGGYRDAEEKAENLSREKRIAPYKTVGNIVTFGHYEQDADTANGTEAIEWIVLDVQDGKALLLSRYGLEGKAYHNEFTDITWEECDLRKWLNSEFLKMAFTEEEQSAILTSMVANGVEQGYWKTNGGNDTQDQVFLLSYAEANHYLGVNENANEQAQCIATMYAQSQGALTNADSKCRWWLRSPGIDQNDAACVYLDGSRYCRHYVYYTTTVVRPVFWLNLESDIF